MLKFLFWILLLANASLLAYQRGYLDLLMPSGHEPARISNQLNADKIKIVPAPAVSKAVSQPPAAATEPVAAANPLATTPAAMPAAKSAAPVVADSAAPVAAAPAATASTPPPLASAAAAAASRKSPEKKAVVTACTEIGNFNAEDAKRFNAQLAALSLGERVKQRAVREVISHIVYIPPQGDKEGAEKKAAELHGLGIDDFFLSFRTIPVCAGAFPSACSSRKKRPVRTLQI